MCSSQNFAITINVLIASILILLLLTYEYKNGYYYSTDYLRDSELRNTERNSLRNTVRNGVKLASNTLAWFPKASYVPCETLPSTGMTKSQQYQQWMRVFQEEVFKYHVSLKGSEQLPGQNDFYYRLAQEDWIQTVCEIGFNTGVTALQWHSGGTNRKVYYFDNYSRPYSKPMAEFLNKTVGRLDVIVGDSTATVPAARHLFGKCDLVVVDGGHSYKVALADLINIKKLANPDHHLIIMDDTPALQHMKTVVAAWMEGQMLHNVTHITACFRKDKQRGFSIGVYSDL